MVYKIKSALFPGLPACGSLYFFLHNLREIQKNCLTIASMKKFTNTGNQESEIYSYCYQQLCKYFELISCQ